MCTLLFPTLGFGNTSLPPMGNSAADDRIMLREISDQYVHAGPPSESIKTVQKEASDVWTFVQQSTRLKIPEHEEIAYYHEQYQREALWITRILERASPFIGYVVDELDKRYLPVELSLLPVVESGYQPDVHSPQKAAGIWQIVPATAADVGIRHTSWFDGRSDIRDSTHAAINYLGYLNGRFHGDWPLTLAAYNAGLGRVRAAIKRNKEAGLPTDFWSLALPSETRKYVPRFLALVALLRDNTTAALTLPSVPRGSAFDLLDADRRVSLDQLAIVSGVNEKRLRQLNAGLIRGVTPPDGPHVVYVPQGVGVPLDNALKQDDTIALFSWPDTHEVQDGDTLGSIALRYELPLQQLRLINGLDNDFIRSGKLLKVRKLANDQSRVTYVVTIGDTLSEIAQRFSIDVSAIMDEEGKQLGRDVIHPGETLLLLPDIK